MVVGIRERARRMFCFAAHLAFAHANPQPVASSKPLHAALVDKVVTNPWLRSFLDLECFILSGMTAKDTICAGGLATWPVPEAQALGGMCRCSRGLVARDACAAGGPLALHRELASSPPATCFPNQREWRARLGIGMVRL